MSQLNPNQIDTLREYGTLKVESRKIATRMDDIKGEVRTILVEVDALDNPVELKDLGKLTLRERKLWTYSDKTQALEAQLKEAQAHERSTGIAALDYAQDVFFK